MLEIMHDLKNLGISTSTPQHNIHLVEKMRKGSKQARSEFISQNIPLVAYYVNSFITESPKNAFLIDDLLSEGLVALIKLSDRILKRHSIKTYQGYIYQCIHNAFLDLVKKENIAFHKSLMDTALYYTNPRNDLQYDIETLDYPYGMIALLKQAKYTNNEIANQLGCSTRTVHNRLEKLKKMLESNYAD